MPGRLWLASEKARSSSGHSTDHAEPPPFLDIPGAEAWRCCPMDKRSSPPTETFAFGIWGLAARIPSSSVQERPPQAWHFLLTVAASPPEPAMDGSQFGTSLRTRKWRRSRGIEKK